MVIIKILGVIAEYNPFHNGHLYHLNEAKRLSGRSRAIAVMSGNFVQRGEPALCDKWRRARMALWHGADVVLELPVCFAAAGTDYFAGAAVKILHASGMVDRLCFGSESNDLNAIVKAGEILAEEPPAYSKALKEYLGNGMSFAAARGLALAAADFELPEGLLTGANDTLGIEYCKTLTRLNSDIVPLTVKRTGSSGASGSEAFPAAHVSAKKIREAVFSGRTDETKNAMPPAAFEMLREAYEQNECARLDDFTGIFQYLLRITPPEQLRRAADMTEGLENRFRSRCASHTLAGRATLTELLAAVKTKRYTLTRLQRAALHVILGIDEIPADIPYIRVLGFRRESAFLVGELTKHAALPVIVNLKHARNMPDEKAMTMLRNEITASDIYALAYGKGSAPREIGYEYSMPLVIV